VVSTLQLKTKLMVEDLIGYLGCTGGRAQLGPSAEMSSLDILSSQQVEIQCIHAQCLDAPRFESPKKGLIAKLQYKHILNIIEPP
jgi:hypothetical protein